MHAGHCAGSAARRRVALAAATGLCSGPATTDAGACADDYKATPASRVESGEATFAITPSGGCGRAACPPGVRQLLSEPHVQSLILPRWRRERDQLQHVA